MVNPLPIRCMAIFLVCVLNILVNQETENRISCTKDGLFGKLFSCFHGQGRSPLPCLCLTMAFLSAKPGGDVTTTSCLGYLAPSP